MGYIELAGGRFYLMTNLEVLFSSRINIKDLLNVKAKLNGASVGVF